MTYNILKFVELPKKKYDKRLKPNSAQKLAAAEGLIHFQGVPCKHGHSGLRYTKGSQCIECMGIRRGKLITPRGRSIKNHESSLKGASDGETTYIPENACKRGHKLRYINSNNCVECDKFMIEKHKLALKYGRIKKEYGLSKEEYLDLVKIQHSSCKICGKYELNHFKLHVDHCHDTKKVRGLLCGTCNQSIGMLHHDPILIRKAALYCEET